MPGITTGTGIFSGVDSSSLIDQLIALESRPKTLIQQRVQRLQIQQAAFLDLNSRLSALKSAASTFRLDKTFQKKQATSSNNDVLTATASASATPGTYTFLVDRLVSSQQLLSTGFANRDSAAVGATSLTFESAKARLDRDVNLAELNGGAGVSRGKIVITDSAGTAATVDLSRTITVNEVLQAINNNGTAHVTASVQGGKLILKDTAAGSGTLQVADAVGFTTATSLGIAGSAVGGTITGSTLYSLSVNTPLSALNDGNGVAIKNITGTGAVSFTLTIGGQAVPVNVGDVYTQPPGGELTKTQGAVTTVGGVITRINEAIASAGLSDVAASIDATTGRILITDNSGSQPVTVTESNGGTTARDLGLTTSPVSGSIVGRRVFAGLNTTLATGLNGGRGIDGDGNLNFTTRDGFAFAINLDTSESLTDIFAQIEAASGVGSNGRSRITLSLDSRGTGVTVTDNTGGSSNLIIEGTPGDDTAASFGISTGATGIAANSKSSGNLQRQYLSLATTVASLNNGRGIGTGNLRITDSFSNSAEFNIDTDTKTIADLIAEINSNPTLKIQARVNQNGDGIEIIENTDGGPAGTAKIKIEDVSGAVGKNLNLVGEAKGTGTQNKIDGSFERTVTLTAADTLQTVADKINAARVGATASIISDGSGLTPFRLNLASTATGEAGRFIFDSVGADFGFSTLDAGNNSRVFYGSTDPARAVAVVSTTNTVDSLIPGVKVDLKSPTANPVTLTVATNTTAITTAISAFITAFNTAADRITVQTKYDPSTERAGPLLGESAALQLRAALFDTINGRATNITGQYSRLSEVGFKVGTGGKIELNEDRLREALATDPEGVEALFASRVAADDTFIELGPGSRVRNPNAGTTFTSLGIMGQFEQMVEKYMDSTNGVLTTRNKGIDSQIKLQNDRIAALDVRIGQKRALLQRQFLAMEQAIGQLQGQSSSLGSIARLK